MFNTRVVKHNSDYFVEYKWVGGFFSSFGIDCCSSFGRPLYWRRYSMVPVKDIKTARKWEEDCRNEIGAVVEVVNA